METMTAPARRPDTAELLLFDRYEKIVVCFSGGKDSTAAVLRLLEAGVPKEKMELWHHLIDGAPGTRGLMDWPVTESYCRAFAQAMGLPIRFSWREGGFEREMMRSGTPTAPVSFETDQGIASVGGRGPAGTRLKFPQVSADLKVRWCSAYLKIDVARRVFSNDSRFERGAFLVVTGERRQESAARAKYAEVERHASTNRDRRVDQWRAVIDWSEEEVWDSLRRWRINCHPAYALGWGRVSCALCIFGDKDQWRSARELMPEHFERVAGYERQSGLTIQRGASVNELADQGTSFLADDEALRRLAMGHEYLPEWIVVPEGQWRLPPGAFKRAGGPT
jgi:3'-phosphoadenosine 5'-phosphosulfate sulfotransferase (PAPS reductase)/FAD synthetase